MRCSCAINEVLIRLMALRVQYEVASMLKAGANESDINTTLAEHILPYYEQWRQEMLERAMAEVESLSMSSDDVAPLVSTSRLN